MLPTPMASIVAYIEVRHGAITACSRFALAEARRVADDVGATVYALLALGPTAPEKLSALAGGVGKAGADRVLCCADRALEGPSLDATHGPLLAAVADRLRPTLVLFPAGEAGPELGRQLALRMGASFVPGSSLDIVAARGLQPAEVVVRCGEGDPDGERGVSLRDVERPVVATLRAGSAPPPLGEPASEMEMLNYPTPRP